MTDDSGEFRLHGRQVLTRAPATALPLALPSLAFAAPEPLIVGGRPLSCKLTLPLACMAKAASNARVRNNGQAFESSKYSGWPMIKESSMTGRIQAPTCWRHW